MNPIHFCYWLQGDMELNKRTSYSKEQIEVIKQHALLVLKTISINEEKIIPGVKQNIVKTTAFPPNRDKRYMC